MDGKHQSIDEYLDKGSPRARHHILLALCCAQMADAIKVMALGYVLPQLGADVTDMEKTVLAASVFLGMAIGGFIAGFLANTRGRKYVLVMALVVQGVAAIIAAFMPTMPMLMAMRVITGIGIGAVSPILFILAPEVVGPNLRQVYLNYITATFAVGSVVTAVLAYVSFEVQHLHWRVFYGLTGLWPLATALYAARVVPESPVWLSRMGRMDEFQLSLRKLNSDASDSSIRVVKAATSDFGMQEVPQRAVAVSFRNFFSEDQGMKTRIIFISFSVAWVWYGLSTWAVSLFKNLGVNDPYLSAMFFAASSMVGSAICIWSVERYGLSSFMFVSLGTATMVIIASTMIDHVKLSVVFACLTNIAISGTFNVIVAYSAMVPLADRPLSMGFFGASMRVGSIAAQFVMGQFAAAEKQWIIHFTNASLLGCALVVSLCLPEVGNKGVSKSKTEDEKELLSRTNSERKNSYTDNPTTPTSVRRNRSLMKTVV